ncbi:unnamed protein product [Schistocephalus solidus]|uniref:MRP-S23 domain-containing protein n=1 Tax=Schistocephalus solidus TaxID=70667 RepID=A0A183T3W8_SCHSO|nr:unnamed protein product [Schistocephalus solidus]
MPLWWSPCFFDRNERSSRRPIENSDRPLWFDVYRAFPPNVEPNYERPLPDQNVRNLIYPEDFGRVFVDFSAQLQPKYRSRVISKGMALKLEESWDKEGVFDRIREALQKDGVLLHEKKRI